MMIFPKVGEDFSESKLQSDGESARAGGKPEVVEDLSTVFMLNCA